MWRRSRCRETVSNQLPSRPLVSYVRHKSCHGQPITCVDILYSSKDSPVSKLVVFLVGALVVRGNQSFILSCMRSMSACYRFLGCRGSVFEALLLVCCILWLDMTSDYIAMAFHIRWKWLVPISFYSSRMLGASMMPPTRNCEGDDNNGRINIMC